MYQMEGVEMTTGMAWAVLGTFTLVVLGVATIIWRISKDSTKTVDDLRNDVAWLNNDLTEVKKDVEWLVQFFKRDKGI